MSKGKVLLKKKGIQRAGWILLLLVIWEISVKISGVSPLLFPAVEDVLATLVEDLVHGNLLIQTASSVALLFAALLISLAGAFLLAWLSGLSKVSESFVDTLTVIAHPLPGLAILPLIIMWFGTGTGAVLAIVVHSAIWPLLLNILTGFAEVPRIYTDLGKNLSMSPRSILFEIKLPASAGYIISGIKIGWARGWRAFISAEMVFGAIGGKGGIGWYIFNQRNFMDTAGLFAGILLVIFIGIVVENGLFGWLEKKCVHMGTKER